MLNPKTGKVQGALSRLSSQEGSLWSFCAGLICLILILRPGTQSKPWSTTHGFFDSFLNIEITIHKTRGNVVWGCLCFFSRLHYCHGPHTRQSPWCTSWTPKAAQLLLGLGHYAVKLNITGTGLGPRGMVPQFKLCYQQILGSGYQSKPLTNRWFSHQHFAARYAFHIVSLWEFMGFTHVLFFLNRIHRDSHGQLAGVHPCPNPNAQLRQATQAPQRW